MIIKKYNKEADSHILTVLEGSFSIFTHNFHIFILSDGKHMAEYEYENKSDMLTDMDKLYGAIKEKEDFLDLDEDGKN